MTDYYTAYWQEALECALDGLGILSALTPEQRLAVAKDLATSAENMGMAFGHDAIPNPLETEIRELKAAHKRQIEEETRHHDAAFMALATEVGRIHGIDPQRIRHVPGRGIEVSRT